MKHVSAELSDFLDAQLAPARRAEVEAHLASCGACRGELERLRSIGGALRGLPMQPLPAGFMQRLERRRAAAEKIEEPRSPGFLPFPARIVAFALSSVVCLIVLADQVRQMVPSTLDERLPSAAISSEDQDQARSGAAKLALRQPARAPGEPVPGAVLNEPVVNPAPAAGPTNETIIADIERQKKALGITGIAPKPTPEQEMSKRLRAAAEDMAMSRAPVLSAGGKPADLKTKAEHEALEKGRSLPAEEGGAPLAPADGQPVAQALAVPAGPDGMVVRAEEERLAVWQARGLHASAPRVKYDKSMLILVFAPDMTSAVEIIGVDTKADKILVKYRKFGRLPATGTTALSKPVVSYQYRVVPKSDKPVTFELVD